MCITHKVIQWYVLHDIGVVENSNKPKGVYVIDWVTVEELLRDGIVEIWEHVDTWDEQWQSYGIQSIKWIRVG